MKTLFWKFKAWMVAAVLCAGVGSAGAYWGEEVYDEQQWWNPADWFDGTSMSENWDYDYTWSENDWFDDGSDNQGGGGVDYDVDFGRSDYDYNMYDDDNTDYDYDDVDAGRDYETSDWSDTFE